MNIEQLQQKINELEKENKQLKDGWNCGFTREHFEGEFETLEIDRDLTEENYQSLINKLNNDETMYIVIGERLTELVAEWDKEKMKEELMKKIEQEHTDLIINDLTNELVKNAIIQSQKELEEEKEDEKYCDYCGEEGEIVLHHGDKCCKKCLSYEDEEYCNCKECGRLIERDQEGTTECKDCKEEEKEELKVDTTLPPLPPNLSMSPMTPKQTLSQLSSPTPIPMTAEDLVDYDAEESFLRKQMKKDEEIKYEKNGKPYICKKEVPTPKIEESELKIDIPEASEIIKKPTPKVLQRNKVGKPGFTFEEIKSEEINYKKMKVPELKKLCKSRKIKKYSKLKKQQLIDLLKSNE